MKYLCMSSAAVVIGALRVKIKLFQFNTIMVIILHIPVL